MTYIDRSNRGPTKQDQNWNYWRPPLLAFWWDRDWVMELFCSVVRQLFSHPVTGQFPSTAGQLFICWTLSFEFFSSCRAVPLSFLLHFLSLCEFFYFHFSDIIGIVDSIACNTWATFTMDPKSLIWSREKEWEREKKGISAARMLSNNGWRLDGNSSETGN